ncbi:MAG: YicC family protein [candidate division WOR-3 bacterium]|nr:YicC family protein [candidate division WOR-3 bacterium]
MTGIGRASGVIKNPPIKFDVEIRTYNHRFLDISLKMPGSFSPFEEEIKKIVQANVCRGHVVVVVQQDREILGNRFEVDKELLDAYLTVAREIKKKYKVTGSININTILAIPGLIKISQCQTDTRMIFKSFKPIFMRALRELLKVKKREGEHTKREILKILDDIEREKERIKQLIPERNEYYKKHLNELIKEVNENIDRTRLYQEILYIADRTDVSEEYARLSGHISHFKDTLENEKYPGRRLNFLLQEMQREANTLSVKANYLKISESVVNIKEAIEKIREQVQNIE